MPAVASTEMTDFDAALRAAEAEDSDLPARQVLPARVVDVAVRRRRMTGAPQTDPAMVRFLAQHEPFQRVIDRLFAVPAGNDPDDQTAVPAAMTAAPRARQPSTRSSSTSTPTRRTPT